MSRDPTAGWLAPLSPLSLLLVLLLLSGVGALRPDELFPYGESWGDQLLPEGDDESSAAVKLAIPLRFYDAQFSSLYVSSAPGGARLGVGLVASSQGVEQPPYLTVVPPWGPGLAAALQPLDLSCGGIRIISRESWNRAPLL